MNDASDAKRILLVEDNPRLRELTQTILEFSGFVVLPAKDGAEALSLMQSAGPFDLVITDLVMPGISGIQLADQLSASGPIKVLFVSGCEADEIVSLPELLRKGAKFLSKPFTAATLRLRVEALLNGSESANLTLK
jgi:two-component system cell cycle sensor histidine kinase/response regulator CckA